MQFGPPILCAYWQLLFWYLFLHFSALEEAEGALEPDDEESDDDEEGDDDADIGDDPDDDEDDASDHNFW